MQGQLLLNPCEILILDDDMAVRDSLSWLFKSSGISTKQFSQPNELLSYLGPLSFEWSPSVASCLLLDLRMPEMSGTELFDRLAKYELQQQLPVIFLTGNADIKTAVAAIKHGAFDFIEKPFANNRLIQRAIEAIKSSSLFVEARKSRQAFIERLNELALREKEVMWMISDGLPNKRIAHYLNISIRTVEIHRSRVYKKTQVNSGIALSNLLSMHSVQK